MARHKVKPYSTPGTTWRLKVLHIRHSNLAQLETQYPDELMMPQLNHAMLKKNVQNPFNSNSSKSNSTKQQNISISGRPYSIFSPDNKSKPSVTRSATNYYTSSSNSSGSSLSSSTLTNPNSNSHSNSNTYPNTISTKSSSQKIQLKFRHNNLLNEDEEILPTV